MGKKGKKTSPGKAAASNGAAPAADSSLHGETLKMIKVGRVPLACFSCECPRLVVLVGAREETRAPTECTACTAGALALTAALVGSLV